MSPGFIAKVKRSIWPKRTSRETASVASFSSCKSPQGRLPPKLIRLHSKQSSGGPVKRRRVQVLNMPKSTMANVTQSEATQSKLFPIMLPRSTGQLLDRSEDGGDMATERRESRESRPKESIGRSSQAGTNGGAASSQGSATDSAYELVESNAARYQQLRQNRERDERDGSHPRSGVSNDHGQPRTASVRSSGSCHCRSCRHRDLGPRQLILLVDSNISLEISDGRGGFIPYSKYAESTGSHSVSMRRGSDGSQLEARPRKDMYVSSKESGAVSQRRGADTRPENTKPSRNHARSYTHERKITYGYTTSEAQEVND